MKIKGVLVGILSTVASTLLAGGFAPIPPEVWAMKEDPAKGIKGAVVLEQRISLKKVQVEYVYRVRILGESGRAAADLADFGEEAHSFEGRTVYPDGREVAFNSRKDFKTRTVASVGNADIKRTLMVPPGVTSDCVVEVRWLESAWQEAGSPLPKRLDSMGEWRIGGAWPIQRAVVEVTNFLQWPFVLFPAPQQIPSLKEEGGFKVYTFANLPAREEAPYSLQVTRPMPILSVFYQPDRLFTYARGTPQGYWDAAARLVLKSWYVDVVSTRGAFKDFARELTADLVGGPQAEAREIMRRLEGRIKNRSRLSHQEAADLEKDMKFPEDEDLGGAVKVGLARTQGMRLLLFHLLKARGIQPKLGLVTDRDVRLVNPNFLNLSQFTNHLVGVDEPGLPTLWLDTGMRFAPPGTVHPDYQGTQMLVVDTQAWTTRFENLAPPVARENRRTYAFRIDMEEGQDSFTMDATFAGYPEWSERYRFIPLEAREQERLLREEAEGHLKGTVITQARVLHAQDPARPLTLHLEGRTEQEEARRRQVHPFPGMRAPLFQPDSWPEARQDLIVVPYLRTHRAVSRIRIPKGYLRPVVESFHRANLFGSVSWTVRPLEAPDELEVALEVVVSGFAAKPTAYGDLREFLGWVSDASRRALILGRS